MKIEGTLAMSAATGRAELENAGDVFSFPARYAQHSIRLTLPDATQQREADAFRAAGATPNAMRATFALSNGRAELALSTGETISIPARYAGRVVGIDVFAPGAVITANRANPGRRSERAHLQTPFVDADLDVLG